VVSVCAATDQPPEVSRGRLNLGRCLCELDNLRSPCGAAPEPSGLGLGRDELKVTREMSLEHDTVALFVCEISSIALTDLSWQRLVSVGSLFDCEQLDEVKGISLLFYLLMVRMKLKLTK
jgi:hypothetical protein